MPKFNRGDILSKNNRHWGDTVVMVVDIQTATDTFPDNTTYYILLTLLNATFPEVNGQTIELAVDLVDKIYTLRA